jgi:ParB family chromosome partitioning protein
MNDITDIPLNKLTAWKGNVRKTQVKGSIDDLAASIKAHGLLQNLTVKTDGKRFAVVAGARRLAALQQLVETGHIKATHPIPCKVADGEADHSELSLAENTIRENMHPADECDAFLALIEKGTPPADVAARFGKTEKYVQQRLKLARVSPLVIKAYRKGALTLEHVQAFAVSDDHKAQEKVLKDFNPRYDDADNIRGALTEDDISVTDKRVRYVTLKAYEKAGGTVKRDLFSDDNSGSIENGDLLEELVAQKHGKATETLRKEGWKWVAVEDSPNYKLHRLYAEKSPLPAKLAATVKKLEAEMQALNDQYEKDLDTDEDAEYPERIGEIEEQLREIDKDRASVWTPEQMAIAGTVISIDIDGKASIQRGLVKAEDMPKQKGKSPKAGTSSDGSEPQTVEAELSAPLLESLTKHRTVALSAELSKRPDIALAAVVHALASTTFHGGFSDSSLQISGHAQSLEEASGSTSFTHLESTRESWGSIIPGKPDDLLEWCLGQPTNVLLDLLAFCAATTVNAVRIKNDRLKSSRFQHADLLAAALKLDMKEHFAPTSANYFSKIGKPQILEALKEVDATPPSNSMKKTDMAKYAEQQVAGKGWLPNVLR